MSLFQLHLIRPHLDDGPSFVAGLEEMQGTRDEYSWIYMGEMADLNLPRRNFPQYVATLLEREKFPPPGFVPDTSYWAKIDGEIVGRISLRHELNEFLNKIGGHIGYIVRPTWRRKGVAREMLRQVLDTERARSIGKLLLTCDETNLASERTILANGGVFESFVHMPGNQPRKKRFWITL